MKKAGKIKDNLRFAFFIILIVLFVPSISLAEKFVRIYANVDQTTISVNQTLTLSIIIETKNISNSLKPQLPDLSPFKIIDRSSSSSIEISFVNGKASRIKKYIFNYILKTDKTGNFTIGVVYTNYKGKLYKTNPINVSVTKSNNGNQNSYITDEGMEINKEKIKKEIFINGKIIKNDYYVGEQIVLSYDIFSQHEIEKISLINIPEIEGFYQADIKEPIQITYNNLIFHGKKYEHALLKRFVLFPLYPGNFKITPLKTNITLLIRNSQFSNFFALPYTTVVSSPEIKIKVKPLPPFHNKDSTQFSGIVGKKFEIKTTQYSKNTYLGEQSRFYVIVKSDGNLNKIKGFQFESSIKSKIILSGMYEDKSWNNGKYYFSRKFEYTIIPEKIGTLKIKTEKIIYFDTNRKIYKSKKPDTLYFSIKKLPQIGNKSENEYSNKGLSIKVLKNQSQQNLKPILYSIISVVIILIFALVYLLFKLNSRKNITKKGVNEEDRKDKIKRNIRLLIAESESKMLNNKKRDAFSLLKKALTMALAEKLNWKSARVNLKNLENSNIKDELKEKVKRAFTLSNKIIYSPANEIFENSENIEKYKNLIEDTIEELI